MELGAIVNIILSILSFILALISIITVVITIRQNKRLLEANEQQINEMREEHRLSVQPIIILEGSQFIIERPRFYYTPPEDSYEFISRYYYEATLKNVSSATAICIDTSAKLFLYNEQKELSLGAVTERRNVIPSDKESKPIKILFTGDNEACLYKALRENSVNKLPKIELEIVYKNTCGGYFLCRQTFILAPLKDYFATIRTWHTAITSAPVEAKETIDLMKKTRRGKQWDQVFENISKTFDLKLGEADKTEIVIQLVEIPEKYDFQILSQSEYEKNTKGHSYPKFIHNGVPRCKEKAKDNSL